MDIDLEIALLRAAAKLRKDLQDLLQTVLADRFTERFGQPVSVIVTVEMPQNNGRIGFWSAWNVNVWSAAGNQHGRLGQIVPAENLYILFRRRLGSLTFVERPEVQFLSSTDEISTTNSQVVASANDPVYLEPTGTAELPWVEACVWTEVVSGDLLIGFWLTPSECTVTSGASLPSCLFQVKLCRS